MSRLEKKCLLGSAALHGLLVVIFLFGSAFFTPSARKDSVVPIEIITFNPTKFTDGPSRGGNPNLAPPPPAKPSPEVTPAPQQPKVEPVQPKEVAKPKTAPKKADEDEPDPNSPKIKEPTQKQTRHISTNVVRRPRLDLAAVRAEKERREREEADAKAYEQYRKGLASAAKAAGSVVSGLGSSLSAVPVSVDGYGPGGGGPAVANWRSALFSIYARAWEPPLDAQGSAKGEAKIVIARDGTVLSGRLIKQSGDAAVDRSIIRVLNEVKSVPPFPDEAREEERTVRIIFDLNAKRALG
jgi:TonB family protein